MAESERLSSDPMNLLVSTSVGMWFWIAIPGIHYRPGVAFLHAKKSDTGTHGHFCTWRRVRDDET